MAAPIGLERVSFEPVTQGYGALALRPPAPACPLYYSWWATDTATEYQVQYVNGVKTWVQVGFADQWKDLLGPYGALLASAAAGGIWILRTDGGTPTLSTAALAAASAAFPLDPTTNYAVAGRTPQVRIAAQVITSSTAPGITFTFRLYPVNSVAAFVPTLGTGVGDAVVTTPALNTQTAAYGAAFTMPATGHYVLGCLTSGANASITVQLRAALQVRAV